MIRFVVVFVLVIDVLVSIFLLAIHVSFVLSIFAAPFPLFLTVVIVIAYVVIVAIVSDLFAALLDFFKFLPVLSSPFSTSSSSSIAGTVNVYKVDQAFIRDRPMIFFVTIVPKTPATKRDSAPPPFPSARFTSQPVLCVWRYEDLFCPCWSVVHPNVSNWIHGDGILGNGGNTLNKKFLTETGCPVGGKSCTEPGVKPWDTHPWQLYPCAPTETRVCLTSSPHNTFTHKKEITTSSNPEFYCKSFSVLPHRITKQRPATLANVELHQQRRHALTGIHSVFF